MKYDGESDVLTIVVRGEGRLFHAEELEDIVLHLDAAGRTVVCGDTQSQRGDPPHGPSVSEGRDRSMSTPGRHIQMVGQLSSDV